MKEFKVLPTNPDFQNLTDAQIEFILYSMQEDHKERERARKGLMVDSQFYDTDYEQDVMGKDIKEWDVLKEGHDADEIAKQVNLMTKPEDQKNLSSKFDGLGEYNEHLEQGGKTGREAEVDDFIKRQLKVAEDRARDLEKAGKKGRLVDDRDRPEASGDAMTDESKFGELDKTVMDRAIEKFESKEKRDKNDPDPDDDFSIL
jgi:hypothetical protein